MELLPELFCLICEFANISSIRIFYRTSQQFYELGKKYIENKLVAKDVLMIKEYHNMEQFTVELALDGFDIPESHYDGKNEAICPVFAYLGKLDLLKKAVSKGCPLQNQTFVSAAIFGRMDIIDQYCSSHPLALNNPNEVVRAAATNGHLCVVSYMDEICAIDHAEMIKCSAHCGHLHILQSFDGYSHLIPWTDVVRFEHINIIEWGIESCGVQILNVQSIAVRFDCADMFEWTIKQGYPITDYHYELAYSYTALNIIRRILSDRTRILQLVAERGSVFLLKKLIKWGWKIDESVFTVAVHNDSMDVIEWMIKNEIVTKPIRFSPISSNEKTKLLAQYNLIHLDSETCIQLAYHGFLDYIKGKLDGIPKSNYHFSVGNNIITKLPYNGNSGPKLICLDGEVRISSLETCNCWWHLLAFTQNADDNETHIDKMKWCDHHRAFLEDRNR